MSTFKRPSQRVRPAPPKQGDKPREGSFLYDIITKKPTEIFKFEKGPVYQKELYLRLLKKNYEDMNVPYVEPVLPDAIPIPVPKISNEPELVFGDRIQVVLRVLKNGVVRVKVNGAIATMYEKYNRRGKEAPIKTKLQAYKAHGFSKEFLDKIKNNYDKRMRYAKKFPGILEKIFDKQPVKKLKKMKKVEDEEEDEPLKSEEPDEDEPLKSEEPDEDETLDVEPDEDDEEVVEEEYISDEDT